MPTGFAGCSVGRGISRGARKLARTRLYIDWWKTLMIKKYLLIFNIRIKFIYGIKLSILNILS
jgi:hypothetical protein